MKDLFMKKIGETFEIEFTQGWPQKGEILDSKIFNLKMEVLSEPRIKNNKWWQRLINFITFDRYYQRTWTYIVERL